MSIMCRLLAFLGEDTPLSKFLLDPSHSLEKQAWEPRELREAKLNADGFGFAWYNESSQPLRYRQTLPIWIDPNLADITNSLKQPLWIAYIRSATTGIGLSIDNTQPFLHQQWSFVHNGYILDFKGELQHKLQQQLEDRFLYTIKGNTDSEFIFALLMQCLEDSTPEQALKKCVNIIADIIQDKRALLNIIISDGDNIYATKHAINGLCPTLYYSNSCIEFGNNYHLLVSEPLNEEKDWLSIKDHSIISLRKNKEIEITDL